MPTCIIHHLAAPKMGDLPEVEVEYNLGFAGEITIGDVTYGVPHGEMETAPFAAFLKLSGVPAGEVWDFVEGAAQDLYEKNAERYLKKRNCVWETFLV